MGKHLTRTEEDAIIEMYQAGVSYADIEIISGRVARTIRNVLTRREIPKRPAISGSSHHLWKGGRHRNGEGYIEVLLAETHPYRAMAQRSGYVKEHRLVMAQHLGRNLSPREHVHHINGDKRDNQIDNLQLMTHHGSGVRLQCHTCGSHDIGPVSLEQAK